MLIGDWCFPAEHSLNSDLKLPHLSGPVAPPYPNLMKSVKFLRLWLYQEELELKPRAMGICAGHKKGRYLQGKHGFHGSHCHLHLPPLPLPLPPPLGKVEAVHIKKLKLVW
ncbi:hypothetical protein B296_00032098 [Ensete ventricosum]|uniref:Uncharacterized protein n=1 Tax=Ensete ventricosum TaxID=4639 RepID=A0A426Z2B3_ENSVE|nr:hypothetical protein B296_00032098 [Ensete ventricosum]